ncbi:MAG: Ig-like domain-containing protein, partial [Actinomycetes bacterium]
MGARRYVRGRSDSTSRGGRRRPGALLLLAFGVCLLATALLLGAAAASARVAGTGGGRVTNPNSDKALLTFSFQGLSPAAVGTIDESAHTGAVTVPTGTDVTALVATFTDSGLVVYVQPRHYPQASGLTPNDFTSPVTYRVQAQDDTVQDYVVTVTVGAGAASTIAANGGSTQTATVGTAVRAAPSVIVKDANGNPVSGTSVTFAVASGGGAITGASATTNASGIAAVGSWTLGTVAGANSLTATASGLSGSPVTFTATGSVGVPTQDVIETAPDSSG